MLRYSAACGVVYSRRPKGAVVALFSLGDAEASPSSIGNVLDAAFADSTFVLLSWGFICPSLSGGGRVIITKVNGTSHTAGV